MKLTVVALALAVTLGTATSVAARTPLPPTPPVSAALHDDALRPAAAAGWARSELYFAIAGEATASSATPDEALAESRWRAFLDKEVTPRFPDGLTVFDGYGQWLSRGAAAPSRLSSKVLVVLHEDTPQRRADIEAIRLAWKQASGAQSVLWSQQAVAVSF